MTSDERKAYGELPIEENPQFFEDGYKIYLQLRNKYDKNTLEDYDNILNILCASLICFIKLNIDDQEHKAFIQLIWKILNTNT